MLQKSEDELVKIFLPAANVLIRKRTPYGMNFMTMRSYERDSGINSRFIRQNVDGGQLKTGAKPKDRVWRRTNELEVTKCQF